MSVYSVILLKKMGKDLYYKWKNGKVNAGEHVQEMLKGQIKF